MTTPSNRLLRNILRALIDEYGSDDVSRALAKILDKNAEDNIYFEERRNSRRDQRPNDAVKSKKPSAIDQTKKFLPFAKEPEALLNLAARFDRKEFLPHVADIRDFLARMGAASEIVRDRIEGFRHVLLILAQLPSDRLKKLSDVSSPSGPAQLAPLAEAIRSAGEAMRSSGHGLAPGEEELKSNLSNKQVSAEALPLRKSEDGSSLSSSEIEGGSTEYNLHQPTEQSDSISNDSGKSTSEDMQREGANKYEQGKPKS